MNNNRIYGDVAQEAMDYVEANMPATITFTSVEMAPNKPGLRFVEDRKLALRDPFQMETDWIKASAGDDAARVISRHVMNNGLGSTDVIREVCMRVRQELGYEAQSVPRSMTDVSAGMTLPIASALHPERLPATVTLKRAAAPTS